MGTQLELKAVKLSLYSRPFLPATGLQASTSDPDIVKTALMPSYSPSELFSLITFAVPGELKMDGVGLWLEHGSSPTWITDPL